jgi:hypothetical protein
MLRIPEVPDSNLGLERVFVVFLSPIILPFDAV